MYSSFKVRLPLYNYLNIEKEETASPRMFLSGLWGITLGDSGFFRHFMKIGTGWQGTWRGPILELFLSPRASRVKNCYIIFIGTNKQSNTLIFNIWFLVKYNDFIILFKKDELKPLFSKIDSRSLAR